MTREFYVPLPSDVLDSRYVSPADALSDAVQKVQQTGKTHFVLKAVAMVSELSEDRPVEVTCLEHDIHDILDHPTPTTTPKGGS